MFLIFGSDYRASQIAKWSAKRRTTRLISLSQDLDLDQEFEDCEILALPSPISLESMPMSTIQPELILVVQTNMFEDQEPIEVIKQKWPDAFVLTHHDLSDLSTGEIIDVNQLYMNAVKDRIRSFERKAGAAVIENYLEGLDAGSKVSIICHDNPDPDALASGLAVQKLVEFYGHEGKIYHGGLVEHQQNRAMKNLLEIPLNRVIMSWEIDDIITNSNCIITVDFHRSGANNFLPEEVVPNIILDHHTATEEVTADVSMLRPEFSATSSLVASLFMQLGIPMDSRIATALAFGIKTDTLGFSRTFNPVDIRALSWLNAWVDPELMKSIESPPRSRDTLQSFVSAFTNMKEEDGVLLVPINQLSNRDALAQIADFLMSTEEIDTVIAYGPRDGKIILSARTESDTQHLGRVLGNRWPNGRAGGHRTFAGGQIPYSEIQSPVLPEDDLEAMDLMYQELSILFAGDEDE